MKTYFGIRLANGSVVDIGENLPANMSLYMGYFNSSYWIPRRPLFMTPYYDDGYKFIYYDPDTRIMTLPRIYTVTENPDTANSVFRVEVFPSLYPSVSTDVRAPDFYYEGKRFCLINKSFIYEAVNRANNNNGGVWSRGEYAYSPSSGPFYTPKVGDTVILDGDTGSIVLVEKYSVEVKKELDGGVPESVGGDSRYYNSGESAAFNAAEYGYPDAVLVGVDIDLSSCPKSEDGIYRIENINTDHTITFHYRSVHEISLKTELGVSLLSMEWDYSFSGFTDADNLVKGTLIVGEQTSKSVSVPLGTHLRFTVKSKEDYLLPANFLIRGDGQSFVAMEGVAEATAEDFLTSAQDQSYTAKSIQHFLSLGALEESQKDWGDVTVNDGKESVSLRPNTSYTLKFVNRTNDTICAKVSSWSVSSSLPLDGKEEVVYTTGDSIPSDVTITPQLVQTKWPVSVSFYDQSQSDWGTLTVDKAYAGAGDTVNVRFVQSQDVPGKISPYGDILILGATATGGDFVEQDGGFTAPVSMTLVSGDISLSVNFRNIMRRISVIRNDSGKAEWGDFYFGESGTEKEIWAFPGEKVHIRFERCANFDNTERPQVQKIVCVSDSATIPGSDGVFGYDYTLPEGILTDLSVQGFVMQTAWPVTVDAMEHGGTEIQKVDVASSVRTDVAGPVFYLRYGTDTEYLLVKDKPIPHYGLDQWKAENLSMLGDKLSDGLILSSPKEASISATFKRVDFRIRIKTDNPDVSTVFVGTDPTHPADSYFPKSLQAGEGPIARCRILDEVSEKYRVSSFVVTKDGNTGAPEEIVAQKDSAGYFFRVETKVDISIEAKVVSLYNDLTVSVDPGDGSLGKTQVYINGRNIGGNVQQTSVKAGTKVEVKAFPGYGGRVREIVSEGIPDGNVFEKGNRILSFSMPEKSVQVNVGFEQQGKFDFRFGVRNLKEESLEIPGRIEVVSVSSGRVIAEANEGARENVVALFREEKYEVRASYSGDAYFKRYSFMGWQDESGEVLKTELSFMISPGDFPNENEVVRIARFSLRTSGTVTTQWAILNEGVETPLDAPPRGCSVAYSNEAYGVGENQFIVGHDVQIACHIHGHTYEENGDLFRYYPVQLWLSVDSGPFVNIASYDDRELDQDGDFRMLGENITVKVVMINSEVPGYVGVRATWYNGNDAEHGEPSFYSTAMADYRYSAESGASASVQRTQNVVFMASPRPGFRFDAWYRKDGETITRVEGSGAIWDFGPAVRPMPEIQASFLPSGQSNLKEWNGSSENKRCEWRSKVYVGSQFFNVSVCQVYADAYPVLLTFYASSSPDDIFDDFSCRQKVVVNNQRARRIPIMKPEKYFAFKVEGDARISFVGIASSMESLK